MTQAIDIIRDAVEEVGTLNHKVYLWAFDKNRKAGGEALSHLDKAVSLLSGPAREALAEELQAHDAQHRPHDPRD